MTIAPMIFFFVLYYKPISTTMHSYQYLFVSLFILHVRYTISLAILYHI